MNKEMNVLVNAGPLEVEAAVTLTMDEFGGYDLEVHSLAIEDCPVPTAILSDDLYELILEEAASDYENNF